jgi:L-iditol 2-dehydrogenase
MGIHSDGCFAEYVKLSVNLLHPIPDNISFEQAALTEPLAVSVHAVSERCGIETDDTVVVFGPGAIGLLAAQIARAEGAGRVLLVGTPEDESIRFACAHKLGIDTLDIKDQDLREKVMNLTGGIGADVIVEASGNRAAIIQGVKLLRRNGRMAVIGITGQREIPLDWDRMVAKGLSLFFAYSSRSPDWQKALKFLSEKKVKTLPLITHRFRIEQWEQAFNVLETLQAVRPVFLIGEVKDTP